MIETFFQEEIEKASQEINYPLKSPVKDYLEFMMYKFSFNEFNETIYVLPLLAKIQNTNNIFERKKLFQQIGDSCIYQVSFFKQYYDKRILDNNYYLNQARMAYAQLQKISSNHIYYILEKDIKEVSDLLRYMALSFQSQDDSFLLSLYEEYLKDKDSIVKKILEKQGLLL